MMMMLKGGCFELQFARRTADARGRLVVAASSHFSSTVPVIDLPLRTYVIERQSDESEAGVKKHAFMSAHFIERSGQPSSFHAL